MKSTLYRLKWIALACISACCMLVPFFVVLFIFIACCGQASGAHSDSAASTKLASRLSDRFALHTTLSCNIEPFGSGVALAMIF